MSSPARTRFKLRHLIALAAGVAFLAGATAALGVYVNRFGLDGYAGFGFAVVVADAWMLARALSRSSYRRGAGWLVVRSLAAVLLVAGPVLLVIFGYAPVFGGVVGGGTKSAPDRTSLVVAGLLLLPVIACVGAVVGKRVIKDGDGRQA
jgi:hypothetical protein